MTSRKVPMPERKFVTCAMEQKMRFGIARVCMPSTLILGAMLTLVFTAFSTSAQTAGPQKAVSAPSVPPAGDDYTIGAGDIISVSVADAPEWGGKFRVSDSGVIEIAGLSE